MKFRGYSEVTGSDVSGLGEQVGRQRERVQARLALIGRVLAVMSGKGGVGKTYVSTGLARGLARRGLRVGLLDADLAAPTAARLLGARGPLRVDEREVHPAIGQDGVLVFSSDLLLEEGAPLRWRGPEGDRFVWRGTREAGALREFISDVAWGELDALVVDLPPGTDRLADLADLAGQRPEVVAVTIPSEESRRAVARALRAARDAGLAIRGIVENMSGYACPCCATVYPMFPGNAGTALAEEFGVRLLATFPFAPMEDGADPSPPRLDLADLLREAVA